MIKQRSGQAEFGQHGGQAKVNAVRVLAARSRKGQAADEES